jgi:hypothetical protein
LRYESYSLDIVLKKLRGLSGVFCLGIAILGQVSLIEITTLKVFILALRMKNRRLWTNFNGSMAFGNHQGMLNVSRHRPQSHTSVGHTRIIFGQRLELFRACRQHVELQNRSQYIEDFQKSPQPCGTP